jgi:hypothetical protein
MGRKEKFNKKIKIQACKDYEEGNLSFDGISKKIDLYDNSII